MTGVLGAKPLGEGVAEDCETGCSEGKAFPSFLSYFANNKFCKRNEAWNCQNAEDAGNCNDEACERFVVVENYGEAWNGCCDRTHGTDVNCKENHLDVLNICKNLVEKKDYAEVAD